MSPTHPRITRAAVPLLLLCCWSAPTHADVAAAPRMEYEIKVEGPTVKIFIKDDYGSYDRPCKRPGGPYGMVRQNITTGEVHQLPFHCENDPVGNQFLADYCVPVGRYRYGLLQPLDCGSNYHATAEVAGTGSCNDPRNLGPRKVTSTPWDGQDNRISCGDETGCSITDGLGAGSVAQLGLGLMLVLLLALRRRD